MEVVIQEEFANFSSGDLYFIHDRSNNFQFTDPKLNVSRTDAYGNTYTSSFDLISDTYNQSLVSPIDSSTSPYVYKVDDVNAYNSFVSATPDGETIVADISFNTEAIDCRVGNYVNHIRMGSGNKSVYLGSYAYRITNNSAIGSCNYSLTNQSFVGVDPIADFLDGIY